MWRNRLFLSQIALHWEYLVEGKLTEEVTVGSITQNVRTKKYLTLCAGLQSPPATHTA